LYITCLQSDYFSLDIICTDKVVLVVTREVSEQLSTIFAFIIVTVLLRSYVNPKYFLCNIGVSNAIKC